MKNFGGFSLGRKSFLFKQYNQIKKRSLLPEGKRQPQLFILHYSFFINRYAALYYRRAAHERGQDRTTKFVIFFIMFFAFCISSYVGILLGMVLVIPSASYLEPA